MSLSNYPPGVTGMEPQISGIWPRETVVDGCLQDIDKAENILHDVIGIMDDQIGLSKEDDEQFEKLLDELQRLRDNVRFYLPPDEYDDPNL